MRVNKKRSKVIQCTLAVSGRRMSVALNSEELKEVGFIYLGSKITQVLRIFH